MKKVRILDTTLRDGEQSPGVSLNVQEKLEIARQLARLNVDVIAVSYTHLDVYKRQILIRRLFYLVVTEVS